MCLLLSLPDDVVKDVLTNWVHGEDVQVLDGAYEVVPKDRAVFLSVLRNLTLKCQYTLEDKLTAKMHELFTWGLKRGVGLQVLSVPREVDHYVSRRRTELVHMIRTVEQIRVHDAETLQLVAEHAQRLTQLHISNMCLGKVAFSQCLGTVETLDLSCGNVHGFFNGFSTMIACMPNLKRVNLHSTCVRGTQVATILNACPRLQHLDCSHCPNLTADVFTNSTLRHPALQCLNVIGSGVMVLQREAIKLQARFPHLSSLHLEYISNDGVETLLSGLPQLQHLTIADAASLQDTAIHSIASHCPQLLTLYVRGRCAVTDAAIGTLASRCRGLTHLGLSGCAKLTNASVVTVAAHCTNLRYLSHPCIAGVAALAERLLSAMGVVGSERDDDQQGQ